MHGKNMKNILVILIASLLCNVILLCFWYVQKTDIETKQSTIESLNKELNIIAELIPKMRPTASKEDVSEALKKITNGERIDILDNLVSWRFYQFWLNKSGVIESVSYGS
jgi:hypothetical protein